MDLFFTMLVPLTIASIALYAAGRGVDVYSALVQGAGSGLETLVKIIPALVGLMTAVYMLRASGALELLAGALAPALDRLGLPSELLPLMLVRPIAVMLGSTETTFYTIAVYFGAVGITKTRYAVPAALCADLTGFLAAAWAVRICFGSGI